MEAALIIGRQLMGFLGLGIDFRDDRERPFLVECTWYDRFKRQGQKYTHEVKVTDLGGSFLSPCKFTTNEKSTLAEFYYGASKATAHLTVGSEHKLDPRLFREGCQLIADTTERILGDLAQLSS